MNAAYPLRLRCTNCGGDGDVGSETPPRFTEWSREEGTDDVIRCDVCGKRHNTDSLVAVDPETGIPPGEDDG